ncbi:phosphoprotein phosphatase [Schizosaccharomyces octosporus yFS286]|uniref:protein-tyrosine-phosphatase n=1 Tax=Schizosaccharomyces octosporus (strain yFS286) TaxID=483514 RepID=S9RE05_SCHOY|nr:phosphoprotein phosphatase [Schizosaccharomyces octosporus yFS286]EPX72314.1 phosphoprotein phosphatase [Schizosaccharomyces octosporus yFS286]
MEVHQDENTWKPVFSELHSSVQEAEATLRNDGSMEKAIKQVGYADSLDQISKIDENIYISSWKAASNNDLLEMNNIKYVLSAMSIDPKLNLPSDQHIWIPIEDGSSQNILQHISKTIKFIDEAVASNSRVLVHCFAGVSRSVTLVSAYLMKKNDWDPEKALNYISTKRSNISPNPSFLKQLQVYYECRFELSQQQRPYRLWLFHKYGDFAVLNIRVPSDVNYTESVRARAGQTEIRCKKCRFILASSDYIIPHEPNNKPQNVRCTHYFLEPIRWMQPELELGNLEGRFDCPKCSSKIGSYRWQGMQCSCLEWVCPALSVMQSRVDAVRKIM